MGDIKKNLDIVRGNIITACQKSGRSSDDVKLMAVSKTFSLSCIKEAMLYGQNFFGENRVNEIKEKFSDFDMAQIELHLIGHLQSNKVNSAVQFCSGVESADSFKVIKKINDVASTMKKKIDIFLEVNCSLEESKYGFKSEYEIFSVLEMCENMQNINFLGFMTMAPFTNNEKQIRESFIKLRDIRDKSLKLFPFFKNGLLSMGMSNDYKLAIEEGSNIVRIGSAIFSNSYA